MNIHFMEIELKNIYDFFLLCCIGRQVDLKGF